MRIIGGKFRGRSLQGPSDIKTRPTSDRTRESIFNLLENGLHLQCEGLSILDLYAGTGALGIEALSRGASFCLFVEKHGPALKILKKNTENFSEAQVLSKDVLFLKKNDYTAFDLVFLDPPYHKGLIYLTFKRLVSGQYLKEGTYLIIETSDKEKIEIEHPFSKIKEKIYGETKVTFIKYK
ncbi:16S rRNA (guanine(966)-N(2))-methyltransferase RsmD [Alphaproteobacteria bacterium]|jgi:16S rRNA (guanine966-N2)-methyltransferase|nr:16S rRNA (guanine(966)-N(2))-methyltransferase RsmD [Alphaproteobacteria bacterium]